MYYIRKWCDDKKGNFLKYILTKCRGFSLIFEFNIKKLYDDV